VWLAVAGPRSVGALRLQGQRQALGRGGARTPCVMLLMV
jgi:hypothetical protein